MKTNWGMIGILIGTCLVWWSIFTNGLLITLLWIIISACLMGSILKFKEDRLI